MNTYRIKTLRLIEDAPPTFAVQAKTWFGLWFTVKLFYDADDWTFARLQAEDLLEKLQEE